MTHAPASHAPARIHSPVPLQSPPPPLSPALSQVAPPAHVQVPPGYVLMPTAQAQASEETDLINVESIMQHFLIQHGSNVICFLITVLMRDDVVDVVLSDLLCSSCWLLSGAGRAVSW